jgi:hypothetical protein
MSNPLSRTQYPPVSALSVLFSVGLASYEDLNDIYESEKTHCIITAAGNGRTDLVSAYFDQTATFTITDLAAILASSVQAGDELTALKAVRLMQDHSEGDQRRLIWPQFILWAACWLNMPELVEMLLDSGMCPNKGTYHMSPEPSPTMNSGFEYFVSPLYMVSKLGHTRITRILLSRGARTDIL